MMHYCKGENVEIEISKDELPFKDCLPAGTDFLWMHVKGGTHVPNVITFASNALRKQEHRIVVWSGHGGGVVKTISCAEILKRTHPLYQVTRISYTIINEHWKPKKKELEELIVQRKIPTVHILMSMDVIDDSIKGLQKPNTKSDFWIYGDLQQHNESKSNNDVQVASNSNNRPQRQPKFQQNKSKATRPKDSSLEEPNWATNITNLKADTNMNKNRHRYQQHNHKYQLTKQNKKDFKSNPENRLQGCKPTETTDS